jgi:hypothetical protein
VEGEGFDPARIERGRGANCVVERFGHAAA